MLAAWVWIYRRSRGLRAWHAWKVHKRTWEILIVLKGHEYQETSVIARILKWQLRSQNGRTTDETSNDRGGKALRYNQPGKGHVERYNETNNYNVHKTEQDSKTFQYGCGDGG